MNDYPNLSEDGISISLQSDSTFSPDHIINSPHSINGHSPQSLYSSSPNSQYSADGSFVPSSYLLVPNVGHNHGSPSGVEGSPIEQNYLNYVQHQQQPQQLVQYQVKHLHYGLHPEHTEELQQQQHQQHIQQIQNVIYQPNQNSKCQSQNVQFNQSAQNSQYLLPKPNLVWKISPTKSFRYRYLTEKGGHGFLSGELKNSCPTIELQNYNDSVEFHVQLYSRDTSSGEPHSILRILQESDVRQNRTDIKDILKEKVIFNGSNSYQSVTCELRGISIIKLTKEDLQRLGKDLEEAANLVKKFNKTSVCLRVEARNPKNGCVIASPVFSRCINNERGAGGRLRILRRSMYTCPVEGNEELWILSDPVKKSDIEVLISDGSDWKKKCNNIEIFHQHLIICRIPPFDKKRITEPSSMQLLLYRPSDDTWSDSQELKYLPSQSDSRKRKCPNIQYQELCFDERVRPQSVSLQQNATRSQSLPVPPSPPMMQEWIISPNNYTDTSVQPGEELHFNFLELLNSPFSSDLTTDGTASEIKNPPVKSIDNLSTSEIYAANTKKLHNEITSLKEENENVIHTVHKKRIYNKKVEQENMIKTQDNNGPNARDDDNQNNCPTQEIRSTINHVTKLTINEYDDQGFTALHTAILNGATREVVLNLLSHGASINLPAKLTGDTPLIIAVKFGHAHIIQLLLDAADVDLNIMNCADETAINLLENESEAIQVFQSHEKTKHLKISPIQRDINVEANEGESKDEDINDTDNYKDANETMDSTEISKEKSQDYEKQKDLLKDIDETNFGVNSILFYFYCFFPVFLAYYFWVIYYNK